MHTSRLSKVCPTGTDMEQNDSLGKDKGLALPLTQLSFTLFCFYFLSVLHMIFRNRCPYQPEGFYEISCWLKLQIYCLSSHQTYPGFKYIPLLANVSKSFGPSALPYRAGFSVVLTSLESRHTAELGNVSCLCPGQVAQLVGASSYTPKSFQVRFLVRAHT